MIDRVGQWCWVVWVAVVFVLPPSAWAQIAPECRGVKMARDYDEVAQQDFLANYVALTTTLSPLPCLWPLTGHIDH